MGVVVRRFDVWLVDLDPVQGREISKTRPCLVISPDVMNKYIRTVIVAPMTTRGRDYPSRISTTFLHKKGQIALDQIRTVDKQRLVKRLGTVSKPTAQRTLTVLGEMFAG